MSNRIQPASPETLKEFGAPRRAAKIRIRIKDAAAGTGQVFQGQEKIGNCATCGPPQTLSRPASPATVPEPETPDTP